MSRTVTVLTVAVAIGALAVQAYLSHQFTVGDERSNLSYGFALLTGTAICVGLLWKKQRRFMAIAALAIGIGLTIWSGSSQQWSTRWVYLAQHAGINAALCVLFGATLRAGSVSLVTSMALIVHGSLPPPVLRYTRQVTWAWTLYFAGMSTLSVVLFFAAPPYWWSVLANLLNPILVVLMFIGEYLVRHFLLPDFKHATLADGVRAFKKMQGRQPPDPS